MMKAFIVLPFIAFLITMGQDQQEQVEVLVHATQPTGTLYVAVCDCARSYKEEVTCSLITAPVDGTQTTVRFNRQHGSEVAIKVFQDLNGNGELDRNLFGLPTEPYGFSNDPTIRFGPPSWNETRIRVEQGGNLVKINLRS